jgi:hypothetical protein
LGENLYIFDLGNKILIEKEIEEDWSPLFFD